MNPLDWLLAALLVYSTIRAAMRGLVRELFALGGLLVGCLLAFWYYRAVAALLRGLVNSEPLADFCAFLLIIAVVMVVAALLAAVIHRTASAIGLSALDRLGGAVFGAARGLVLGAA
jgi:membrane protein required for colicin V production